MSLRRRIKSKDMKNSTSSTHQHLQERPYAPTDTCNAYHSMFGRWRIKQRISLKKKDYTYTSAEETLRAPIETYNAYHSMFRRRRIESEDINPKKDYTYTSAKQTLFDYPNIWCTKHPISRTLNVAFHIHAYWYILHLNNTYNICNNAYNVQNTHFSHHIMYNIPISRTFNVAFHIHAYWYILRLNHTSNIWRMHNTFECVGRGYSWNIECVCSKKCVDDILCV